MQLEFQEYRPRKLVNVHRHVDGPWFWTKYSAHPYVGCRSGCEFCYLRGGQYLGRRDPNTFDTLIQVKINAVTQLRAELSRLQSDVIACGDWQQPAEDRYRLSRGMLQVVRDLSFPLFIVERSPLVARDADLLIEINKNAWVGVVFSLSNLDNRLKQAFEPRSPGLKRRLQAMAELAKSGILVGVTLMPIIPFAGDNHTHLEEVVHATKDHGGSFVLAGGLTLSGVAAQRTIASAQQLNPDLAQEFRRLYNWKENSAPNYSPPREYSAKLSMLLRELCERHGLKDRMPRYVGAGPLAVNKKIAEKLFLKTYDLELEQAPVYRIWAYRKAAWTIDESSESVVEIYGKYGEAGLQKLPEIGKSVAAEIGKWLQANVTISQGI
jgi:DNA repair photolyase